MPNIDPNQVVIGAVEQPRHVQEANNQLATELERTKQAEEAKRREELLHDSVAKLVEAVSRIDERTAAIEKNLSTFREEHKSALKFMQKDPSGHSLIQMVGSIQVELRKLNEQVL